MSDEKSIEIHGDIPLNPGIVRTVQWLNDNGFTTIDSDDGETHECECDRAEAYVVIRVDELEELLPQTKRLTALLRSRGVRLVQCGMNEKPGEVSMQASYDPVNGICVIDVIGICDKYFFTSN